VNSWVWRCPKCGAKAHHHGKGVEPICDEDQECEGLIPPGSKPKPKKGTDKASWTQMTKQARDLKTFQTRLIKRVRDLEAWIKKQGC
jgi:hypothetical protein